MSRYNINYIEPSINLVKSGEDKKYLGFYLWMKSRKEIILDTSKTVRFMMDVEYDPNWFSNLPSEFYVGEELVNKSGYYERILRLNLQFNNFDYYVFEIQGSCLFRDFLYNINRAAAWATSNRFLFSILDKTKRLDPKYYPVSGEYKGSQPWIEAFDTYMDWVRKYEKTDINRLKMPYSISSYFWVGLPRKILVNVISLMKYHMPFFYEVYGRKMEQESGINEFEIHSWIDSSLNQYMTVPSFKEGVVKSVCGTTILQQKMGLILYSQFLRQSDSTINGLYKELLHTDPNEFKDKVFIGETPLEVTWVASDEKVKSTVSTRLCAFAMHSGKDYCSWSSVLNNFIQGYTIEDFKRALPCGFDSRGIYHCKYHDDIKFRGEGLEISNDQCPLLTLRINEAYKKKETDNNLVGDLYYDLTWSMVNSGARPYTGERSPVEGTEEVTNDEILELIKLLTQN